jgi:hypothetical protein
MDGLERSAELLQALGEDLHGDGNDEVREGHGGYECFWGVGRGEEWSESVVYVCR